MRIVSVNRNILCRQKRSPRREPLATLAIAAVGALLALVFVAWIARVHGVEVHGSWLVFSPLVLLIGGIVNGNAGAAGSFPSSPFSLNFHSDGSPTTAGNALFAWFFWYGSLSVTTPSGWSTGPTKSESGGDNTNGKWFYLENASSLTSLSISWTGSTSGVGMCLVEASGVTSLDQSAGTNSGSSSSLSTDTITPAQTGELILAGWVQQSGGTGSSPPTFSSPTNGSTLYQSAGTSSGSGASKADIEGAVSYLVDSGSSALNLGVSSTVNNSWGGTLMAFKMSTFKWWLFFGDEADD
jgi:hypothetical protein